MSACRGPFCPHANCDALDDQERVGLSTVLDIDGGRVRLSNEDGSEDGADWFSVAECDAMVTS